MSKTEHYSDKNLIKLIINHGWKFSISESNDGISKERRVHSVEMDPQKSLIQLWLAKQIKIFVNSEANQTRTKAKNIAHDFGSFRKRIAMTTREKGTEMNGSFRFKQ